MHSRKSVRRRCVRRLTVGTRMATVWLIVHQKSSMCIEYSIPLPDILSRFGKEDLETHGLCCTKSTWFSSTNNFTQNFRTIFWYEAIQLFISLYRVLYRLKILSTGWRKNIGSPKLQIVFHKRATKYRALFFFCRKWPVKIRDPMSLRHPVPREMSEEERRVQFDM